MARFIKCSLRFCLTVMNSLLINEEKQMWMHTESLSAFMLLHCQLRSAVKALAKWSVWRASLLMPQVLKTKFIQSVRTSAWFLGWLPGLGFVQLAVDFKCPVRNVLALIFAFQQSSFLKEWQILKALLVINLCYVWHLKSWAISWKKKNCFNVSTSATSYRK